MRDNALIAGLSDCVQAAVSMRRSACSSSDQVNAAAFSLPSHFGNPHIRNPGDLSSWIFEEHLEVQEPSATGSGSIKGI